MLPALQYGQAKAGTLRQMVSEPAELFSDLDAGRLNNYRRLECFNTRSFPDKKILPQDSVF